MCRETACPWNATRYENKCSIPKEGLKDDHVYFVEKVCEEVNLTNKQKKLIKKQKKLIKKQKKLINEEINLINEEIDLTGKAEFWGRQVKMLI